MANTTTTLDYGTATQASYTFGSAIVFNATSVLLDDVPPYATSNPPVTHTAGVLMDSLDSFEATIVATGNDAVQFILKVDGTNMWWDGSDWIASAGTLAESNTAAEIDTNAAALDLSGGKTVKVVALLHSDVGGATTPALEEVVMVHGFAVAAPTTPDECVVYGFVTDHTGAPVSGATVKVTNAAFFHHSNYYVKAHVASVETDAAGYWEIDLIETASVRKWYSVEITYSSGGVSRTDKFPVLVVPNTQSANFASLV